MTLILLSLGGVWLPGCASIERQVLKPVLEPIPSSELEAPRRVRRAVRYLGHADVFAAPAGSNYAVAFNVILRSKAAHEAFEFLLKAPSLEGQLYGLSGLYFTDRERFEVELQHYRQIRQSVTVSRGCIVTTGAAGMVADAKTLLGHEDDAEVVRLHLKRNPPMDIASGAWPLLLTEVPRFAR